VLAAIGDWAERLTRFVGGEIARGERTAQAGIGS